jgi:hypothetical protein
MTSVDETARFIDEIGRKYLWWEPVDGSRHTDDRILAQAMNLGTFDDVISLEEKIGEARLVSLMKRAQPGWFNDRSWEFWRGRLLFSTGEVLSERPPLRSVHDAAF